MSVPVKIDKVEFKLMSDYIEQSCGIRVTEEKMYLVETRLTTLMVENGCTNFRDFYVKSLADTTKKLRDKIIDAMTTNETLWFRDTGPYHIFQTVVLPAFAEEFRAGKLSKLRIWSAASSTGQEPYSISMSVMEHARLGGPVKPSMVEILATDISPTVLYIAQAGRYDNLVIGRGLGEEMRNRYFKQDGKVWVLSDDVKKQVTFKKYNLQESFASLGKFDVVFCRNVLIYFSDVFKKDVLHRINDLLKPKGYFFLGASESLINYTNEYTMLRHSAGLYYQVK